MMSEDPARFARAMELFDLANAEDPNLDEGQPKELLYARRMSEMLGRFAADASETVALAVRAQHIRRWTVPRSSYPMTKAGYYAWRTGLYQFHAVTAGRLMREAGYDDEDIIERVQKAVGKRGMKVHAETQLLEDVTDLVFLEHYLVDFAGQKPDYSEEKWLEILRKTWRKMSDDAHAFALSGKLALPEALLPLIRKAVAGG